MRVEITIIKGKDKSQAVTDEVMKRLCEKFGGASIYDNVGAWFDQSGKRHDDKSTVIYSYVSGMTYDSVAAFMNGLAYHVKRELDELSVMYAIHRQDIAFFV